MRFLNGKWCLTVSIVLVMLAMVSGCGDGRPAEMPATYPTSITITQDGAPLAGATVVLYPEDSTLTRWPIGGTTNEQGTAEIMTSTKYSGAPAGKFKVIVNKTVTEGDPRPAHPGKGATREQITEYDRALKSGKFEMFKVVEQKYRTAGTTTLNVEITDSGENNLTEDVGKAVKDVDVQASATSDAEYVPMGGSPE